MKGHMKLARNTGAEIFCT